MDHPLMTDRQVNELAFEIEKLHHGTPSGIDNTVITYAKPVYFIKDRPIETFKVGKPFTIVIGDTGIPAPTKESVGDVRRLRMHDQNTIENIFNEIAQIALIGRRSIESGKPEQLGELMDQNHKYLQALTVSSPELEKLVEAARNAGALGAKLSGSGRGGNMIALVEQAKAKSVAGALMSAGAKRTIITEIS
jgi:mevalonate kinase